jgi:hypothetical protein
MISVFRGSNYLEAQLLVGLLAQHHIHTFLQGAALQGGLGEAPAIGYLSILVNEDDAGAAKHWLAAYERGELALQEGDFTDDEADQASD